MKCLKFILFSAIFVPATSHAQGLCSRVDDALRQHNCPNASALCNFLGVLFNEARLPGADGSISVTAAQIYQDGGIPTGLNQWEVDTDPNVSGGKYAKYIGPNSFSMPVHPIISDVYIPTAGVYKINTSIRRGGYNNNFPECANATECNDFFASVVPVLGGQPVFLLSNGSTLPADTNPVKEFAGDWVLSGVPTAHGVQRTALEWPHGVFSDHRVYFPRAGVYSIVTYARSRGTEFIGFRVIPDFDPFDHPTNRGTPYCRQLP